MVFNILMNIIKDQYAFIHDAVLETLICGDTQIPASDIRRSIDQLKNTKKSLDGESGFDRQFQVNNIDSQMYKNSYCNIVYVGL